MENKAIGHSELTSFQPSDLTGKRDSLLPQLYKILGRTLLGLAWIPHPACASYLVRRMGFYQ